MTEQAELKDTILQTLEDIKALNVVTLHVAELTSVADYLIVASGTSSRHLKAMSEHVVTAAKGAGVVPLGVEGEQEAEWILVDLGDIVVHLMMPETREYYALEKLWYSAKLPTQDASGV